MSKQSLTESDFKEASNVLHCEVACVKAVAEVESTGNGFLSNDLPKILFEAHKFHELTGGIYDKKFPNISSPVWNKALYMGGQKEYSRLAQAKQLNETAALLSTSWGKFQIMGFNFKLCGYNSVQQMVEQMQLSECNHLIAFVMFLKSTGLDKHLITKEWALFAEGYNGNGYKQNNYDTKLQTAYLRFANCKL